MWRACRVAALRQLRSEAAHLPAARAPMALQQQLGSVNCFTSIAGVDRESLLKRSARDLRDEFGGAQLGKVSQALKGELADAMAREDVTSDEIIDLFTAAQKTRAVGVMLDAFKFLEDNYPAHINFAVYGEIFRVLQRKHDGRRMLNIYESAKPRFKAVPEMVYRFGIVGSLQKDDMKSALEIWQEMTDAGHETTNEITSRLMMAYAYKGDAEKVQELYESVDPQIGYWHESCIDRVIVSMGIIEQPAKAFDFYSNSSMKLNGGTLIALLSVCISNKCQQQASDILANRMKFDLRLDARGYNRIMMALEMLERNDEIKEILDEMVEHNIRFDTRTHTIIERNAKFLEDTNFVANGSESKAAGFTVSPRLREKLAEGNASEAAKLVDSVAKPVQKAQLPDDFDGDVPEGALYVSPSVARDAVRSYIASNQPEKVAALVKGFSSVPNKYGYALGEVLNHYLKLRTKTGDELSYNAFKAMLFQGIQIYRVDDALMLFRRFHDADATVELFDQLLVSYWGKDARDERESARVNRESEDDDENQNAKRSTSFVQINVGRVINAVMHTLAENGRVVEAVETLNKLEKRGLRATTNNYVSILSSMRKHVRSFSNKKDNNQQKVLYDVTDLQRVLKDLKNRGLKVNRAVIGNLCPAYTSVDKQQRLELLEAFTEAQSDPNDTFVLPYKCYETLLKFTAQEGDISAVNELYEEAVSTLPDQKNLGIPRGWVTVVVMKLARDGNVEEAEELAKQMPDICNGYTYRALKAVLCGAMEDKKLEIVDNMVALLEERDFVMSLADAYEQVHLARKMDLPLKALDIIRVFEKGNLKEVDAAEDGKGNLEAAFFGRQRGDMHALRKVRTMYSVTLKMCEKEGLWKEALMLRDRMTPLLGQEAMDQINQSASAPAKKKRWDKRDNSPDHDE